MDTRRCFSKPIAAMLALALVAVGCAPLTESAAGSSRDEYGVVAEPPLPTAAPKVDLDPSRSIASADATVLVDLEAGMLRFRGGTSNETIAQHQVGEAKELRAVSGDGLRAAVFEHVDEPGSLGTSRITTVDVHTSDSEPMVRNYEIDGLVEPEAFSTDGASLFVIDHQAGNQIGSYRVRPLDLETGALQAIVGPSKIPFTENMNGTGRRQIWAPGAERLYTLYIRQTHHHHDEGDNGDHGGAHSHSEPGTDGFVHVLDLKEEWAFCLDLPAPFGNGDLATTALAVSPDGATIAVADMNANQVAFASTEDLVVTRVAALPPLEPSGELHLGLTDVDLILGWGAEAHWFDRDTLEPRAEGTEQLRGDLMGFTSPGNHTVLAWPAAGSPQKLLAPS